MSMFKNCDRTGIRILPWFVENGKERKERKGRRRGEKEGNRDRDRDANTGWDHRTG